MPERRQPGEHHGDHGYGFFPQRLMTELWGIVDWNPEMQVLDSFAFTEAARD